VRIDGFRLVASQKGVRQCPIEDTRFQEVLRQDGCLPLQNTRIELFSGTPPPSGAIRVDAASAGLQRSRAV
jgi:hypothetical protein